MGLGSEEHATTSAQKFCAGSSEVVGTVVVGATVGEKVASASVGGSVLGEAVGSAVVARLGDQSVGSPL